MRNTKSKALKTMRKAAPIVKNNQAIKTAGYQKKNAKNTNPKRGGKKARV